MGIDALSIFLMEEFLGIPTRFAPMGRLIRPRLLRLTFGIRALRRESFRENDGNQRDEKCQHGDHVRHRSVARTRQLREDPDRKRFLLTRSKCCDDDLIERERE